MFVLARLIFRIRVRIRIVYSTRTFMKMVA